MSTRPGLLVKTIWTLAEYSEGNQHKRVVDLPARPILVGQSHEADLSITHGGVSKQHASIHFEQNHMVVEDLGSTNGTYVNGWIAPQPSGLRRWVAELRWYST